MKSAGQYRYGIVVILLTVAALFAVLCPVGDVSRGVLLLLQGAVLFFVLLTSDNLRDRRTAVVAGVALLVVAVAVGVAVGLIPKAVADGVTAVVVLATFPELVLGLAKLLKTRGVTLQAVSGGLAIYLMIGMVFALAIGVLAAISPTPYFAQGTEGTLSEHVYFSFTTMTTTGFGDLSAGTSPGRAVAVLEMLIGQIYLVTVISMLIGRALARPPMAGQGDGS